MQQARTLHALEILTATSSGEVINYNMHRENTITLHAGKIQIVRKFQKYFELWCHTGRNYRIFHKN